MASVENQPSVPHHRVTLFFDRVTPAPIDQRRPTLWFNFALPTTVEKSCDSDMSGRNLKPEHVLHAVQAGLLSGDPAGGAERAVGKSIAAVGAVDELETLADAAENHRVLADDAFAAAYGDRVELAFQPVGHRAPERQRGAARRVFLEPMVRLDDLDVVVVAEHLGGFAEQRDKHVHAETGVGR